MRRIRRSFGYAFEGFIHAFAIERSLQLFIPVYILVLVLGGLANLLMWEWLALVLSGGFFLSIELLNTSLERLADVLDEERKLAGRRGFHAKMKATKDVAAAASLMSLIAVIATVCIVFAPYVNIYILH
jgi:diacylglycerol kinase